MTKFQFHVLIALALLILANMASDFTYYIYMCLCYIFTVFAVFDAVKVAQEENLKEKNNYRI